MCVSRGAACLHGTEACCSEKGVSNSVCCNAGGRLCLCSVWILNETQEVLPRWPSLMQNPVRTQNQLEICIHLKHIVHLKWVREDMLTKCIWALLKSVFFRKLHPITLFPDESSVLAVGERCGRLFWVQDCRTTQTWAEAKGRSHASGRALAWSHQQTPGDMPQVSLSSVSSFWGWCFILLLERDEKDLRMSIFSV